MELNKYIKGIDIIDWVKIMQLNQRAHSFARWPGEGYKKKLLNKYPTINTKILDHGYNIKYTEFGYDSRSQDIWWVKFRGLGPDLIFRTNSFVSRKQDPPFSDLYTWVTEYLLGNWTPPGEQYIKDYMS